ncbi:MAG: hypothetical protein Q7S68_04315 [Deltaproteobacteria bacterium]|nr:hypothetical protein [Deltaproteobacteria bacterium]
MTTLDSIAEKYRLTFQERRIVEEAATDLKMWGEKSLEEWWRSQSGSKDEILKALRKQIHLLQTDKKYSDRTMSPPEREPLRQEQKQSDKKIAGLCPVASEETVCCNLRTIDVAENCGFGCSYCTIQTFYGDKVVFDAELGKKLKAIPLDPTRLYHYGIGQSSDSLMWGNRFGIFDDLCGWAAENPNVLLEFKTKSNNVGYFLENEIPKNVVLSWSLNTPTIIQNEEHFTARLEQRLEAARKAADRGIKVAFHFHPMVYYEGWSQDYKAVTEQLLKEFQPAEVAFVSIGTLTYIKPVLKAIRQRGGETKILQMPMVKAAKHKWSYPNEVKIEMFRHLYSSLESWQSKTFFYICMEKAEIWNAVFGFAYPTNEEFEKSLLANALPNGVS